MITQRPARDIDDLRRAESILTRAWLDAAPFVASHLADLEWWYASSAPDALAEHLRLWDLDGSAAAWSWSHGEQVHWEVWTGDPADEGPVLEAILHSAIHAARGPLRVWAPEDDPATLAILDRLGFHAAERRLSQFQRRVDDDTPIGAAGIPDGYRIRHVGGPTQLPDRVEVHRAAFAPSLLTVEKYERLASLPHYRFEDDLVVEAPDGSIAAFAMAWWDPVARVGEFEPVGTHPDHQRRGLGRALLEHGLRRYRDHGAGIVQVYSNSDNAASEGLYQAVGFHRRRHRRHFERPSGGDVRSVT